MISLCIIMNQQIVELFFGNYHFDRYIVTIGVVEPSYVIRQFLTAQQIQNLTLYLEELHKTSANADHTTLLLNCYTKLKVNCDLQKSQNQSCHCGNIFFAVYPTLVYI